MRTRALNIAGKSSLKGLAYLYQKCAVVISTDTGPTHVAAAMTFPIVIGLFVGLPLLLKLGPMDQNTELLGLALIVAHVLKKSVMICHA